jgi:hypothetical protein
MPSELVPMWSSLCRVADGMARHLGASRGS